MDISSRGTRESTGGAMRSNEKGAPRRAVVIVGFGFLMGFAGLQ
jgi:hypothetical protein